MNNFIQYHHHNIHLMHFIILIIGSSVVGFNFRSSAIWMNYNSVISTVRYSTPSLARRCPIHPSIHLMLLQHHYFGVVVEGNVMDPCSGVANMGAHTDILYQPETIFASSFSFFSSSSSSFSLSSRLLLYSHYCFSTLSWSDHCHYHHDHL